MIIPYKKGVVLHLICLRGVAKHPQLQNKEAHTIGASIHLFTCCSCFCNFGEISETTCKK